MKRMLLMTCVLALVSTTAWSRTSGQTPGPREDVIDIVAERFTFTPSEVKTTVGTRLTIRLTSDDTAHGFRLIGTNVNVEIPKRSRGATTITFTPEAPGKYTFECAKVCGAGHSFMRGIIIAEPAPEEAK